VPESTTVLTVEELAQELRISRSLAYRLVASGDIPAVRLGTAWRVPRHVVDDLLGRVEGAGEGR
jgi:excisionase family DNA binding protein